jgi:hypothetical protein
MKSKKAAIFLAVALVLGGGLSAHAGPFYNLSQNTSSATMNLSGVLKVAASAATYTVPTVTINGVGGTVIATGTISAARFVGDGSQLTGLPTPAGFYASLTDSNYYTGVNQFHANTYFDELIYTPEIFLTSATPRIMSTSLLPILVYPGVEVNSSTGYAMNRVYVTTSSIDASYYTYPEPRSTTMTFDHNGLFLSSGVIAGVGRTTGFPGVQIINNDGKIPALTSDYLASLDGSALTGIDKTDVTKVPLGGGVMTGSLIFEPTSISTGQVIFQGAYPHSVQFNNQSATSAQEFLGEVQFLQSGTGKRRIIGFGDNSATYPKELQIGADTTSLGTNVRITGSNTLSPDLFVSSWTSVGVSKIPNAAYKLDVAGSINATGIYENGVPLTGGSGGDNLGSHIATMTVQANYGLVTTVSTHTRICLDGDCIDTWPMSGTDLFFTGTSAGAGYYLAMSTTNPAGQASTTTVTPITSDVIISSYVFANFQASFINEGFWMVHAHGYVNATLGNKTAQVYYRVYVSTGGKGATETLLLTTEDSPVLTTTEAEIDMHAYLNDYAWTPGNSLIVKAFSRISGTGSDPAISLLRAGAYASHLALPSNNSSFGGSSVNLLPLDNTWTGANTFSQAITGSVTGNAGTVTNGVYTNGSYANPAWITSLATSKIDLSTVTTALAGKLSNTATVPTTLVDLSTVTTALAGKLSNTATVPTNLVNLSTVTTALAGKLSNTATVPTTLVDLSTVTTALAGKQATGDYLTRLIGDVLAIGPGMATATIAHVPNAAVDLSTVATALAGKLSNTATVPTTLVDLSTVTTALSGKVAKAGDTMTGQLTVSGSSITIASDLLDYQLILTGANKRNMKFDDRHADASTHNLAEIDFLQLGTLKHQISAYGDTNATYPQELQLGSPSGTASKVRITGSATLNPDIFVSSFSSVGINTASPNAAYKLDVNGALRATNLYGDGSGLTGIVGTGASALLVATNSWTATQNFLNETNFNIGTGGGIGFQNYTGTDYGGITYQGGINYFFGGPAQLGAQIWNGKVGGPSVTVVDSGVGVNDTSPSYALDVNGGIRATSTMTASAYYGDGSTLTGVATAGSSTTFTGANTFTRSVTASSFTVTPGVGNVSMPQAYVLVCDTQTATQVTSLTCSNLPGAGAYRMVVDVYKVTAGIVFGRINADTANNYKWADIRFAASGVGYSATVDSSWHFSGPDAVAGGEVLFSDVSFATSVAGAGVIRGTWSSGLINSGSNWETITGSGFYNGASAISSLYVAVTAGTFTGRVRMYRAE